MMKYRVLILIFFLGISNFNLIYAQLSSPKLISPPFNQKKVSTTQIQFVWSKVDSAEKYILELTNSFKNDKLPLYYVTVADTSIKLNVKLDSGKIYYWNVKSIKASDTSALGAIYYFATIFPPIKKPVIKSPINDTLDRPAVILAWDFQLYANSYSLQVAKDSLFNDLTLNLNDITIAKYTYSTFNMNGISYYWRVRATNPDTTTDWSEIGKFYFKYWDGPTLVYPKNGDTNVSIRPQISWMKVDSATSYVFRIPTISYLTILQDTSLVLVSDLEYGTVYQISIATRIGTKISFESVAYFRTVAPPTRLPNIVSLNYPENNAEIKVPKPRFEWQSDSLANSYELWVSDSSAIDDPKFLKIDISGIKDTFYLMDEPTLFQDKDYYWRVRGINITGKGKWSEVRKFDTSGFSDVSDFDRQTAISITPNPATDFIEIQNPENGAIEILNLFGQNVNLTPALSIHGEGVKLDVSDLAPGVYFVRIGDKVQKFVKI